MMHEAEALVEGSTRAQLRPGGAEAASARVYALPARAPPTHVAAAPPHQRKWRRRCMQCCYQAFLVWRSGLAMELLDSRRQCLSGVVDLSAGWGGCARHR